MAEFGIFLQYKVTPVASSRCRRVGFPRSDKVNEISVCTVYCACAKSRKQRPITDSFLAYGSLLSVPAETG